MLPLISDARFNSVALIIVALITVLGTILTTLFARQAKNTAVEARDNAQEAKVSAAEAAHEVRTNGGMTDPNPNLNDHVKYQTEMAERLLHVALPLVAKVDEIDRRFTEHLDETRPLKDQLAKVNEQFSKIDDIKEELDTHLRKSAVMDQALAAVFFEVKPDVEIEGFEDNTD